MLLLLLLLHADMLSSGCLIQAMHLVSAVDRSLHTTDGWLDERRGGGLCASGPHRHSSHPLAHFCSDRCRSPLTGTAVLQWMQRASRTDYLSTPDSIREEAYWHHAQVRDTVERHGVYEHRVGRELASVWSAVWPLCAAAVTR